MEFMTTPRRRQSIQEEEEEEERDPYSSPTQSIHKRHAQWQRQRERSFDHRYRDTSLNMAASFAEARRLTSPRIEKQHSRVTLSAVPSSLTESISRTTTQDEFMDIGSPILQDKDESWFQNDDYDEQEISDTDPLEELDTLANQLDENDLLQQYNLENPEEDRFVYSNSTDESIDSTDNNSNNNSRHNNHRNRRHINSLRNRGDHRRIDGILWPFILPLGEIIYEKTVFGLFFIVYSIKETLLSMAAFLDSATCVLFVNSVLWILHKLGFMRELREVRMFNRRQQSQPVFQFIAVLVYLWLFYTAFCYSHESNTVIKYGKFYESVHGLINGNHPMMPSTPSSPRQPPPMTSNTPGDQHYGSVGDIPTTEQTTDTIREAVERILSSIIPSTKNGDFISNLQAYLNDHYVQRTELQEKQLGDEKYQRQQQQYYLDKQQQQNQQQTDQHDSLLQQVADFALATRGARVIPKMTSTTYTPSKKHPWKAAVARALGIHPGTYRASPLIALLPDTHVGQCWPMDGSNGTLSIVLSQPIDIKSITMEYPTKDQMVNMTSAPKDFEIWGLRKVQVPFFTSIQWPWHQHNTNDTNAKHLGTFRYDIQTGRSIQTFNVVNSHEKKEKEVNQDEEEGHSGLFEAVIVRVISNWGLEAYTCLYRVRVHGEPL